MDDTDTIEVIVLQRRHPLTGRQALPRPEDLVESVKYVSVGTVRNSIQKTTAQMAAVVSGLPTSEGPMQLHEISVGLTVTASGQIGLVAGAGIEAGSTITLTYKVTGNGDDEVN